MPEPQEGPKVQLASLLLGEKLGDWVKRQRTTEELSWPQIARKLRRITRETPGSPPGGVVINEEWLRVLYRDRAMAAPEPVTTAPAAPSRQAS